MIEKLARFPARIIMFFMIAMAIPLEHMYDRVFRPYLFQYTSFSKDIIERFYLFGSDVIIALLFVFMLFSRQLQWKAFFLSSPARYLWLIAIVGSLSLVLGEDITAIHWMKFFYFVLGFVLFSIIVQSFRQKNIEPFLKAIAWGFFCISLFECYAAISQYFTQHAVGLRLFGEPKLDSSSFTRSAFWVQDGTRWLFDRWFLSPSKPIQVMRAYGTLPHPNVLGGFLVYTLCSSYALFLTEKKTWLKWLVGLGIVFQVFSLFLTFSRAALFAWIGVHGIWLIWRKKETQFAKPFLQLLLIVITSAAFSFTVLFSQIFDRGGIISYHPSNVASDGERVNGYYVAGKLLQNHPWFGIGFMNFEKYVTDYFPKDQKVQAPHNIYLRMAAEMGMPSLVFFVFFICSVFFKMKKKWKNPFVLSFCCAFLAFLAIGQLDFYILYFQQGKLLFFFMTACIVASAQVEADYVYYPKYQIRGAF